MGPEKGSELPPKILKSSPPPPPKEHVPKLKIFPSEKLFRRKSTFVEQPLKQKGSSIDSVHGKVSRSGSQTKRKVSPSDVMPKRNMSASDPRFQRRISLTEFPGSRKISPSGSPPYQKLGSSDFNGEIKHTKRKRLSKALTLTHDPTYHQDGLSDISPSPYNVRKFFPDNTLQVEKDKTFSSESLSPYYQPKEYFSECQSQIKLHKYASRESMPTPPPPPPPPPSKPVEHDPSLKSRTHFKESPSLHEPVTGLKEKLFSGPRKQPSQIPPLLIKQKSTTEAPSPQIKRHLSSSSERETHKGRLRVSKKEVTPPMPIISTPRLSPIDSLPQLIRRASCKPTPMECTTLISLPSSTVVHDKQHLPPISRQQSLPAEPYSPKPKESRRYERFK